MTLRDVMHSARRSYFTAIETQKKKHWREFLDDNQNVWTALKYLGGMSKKHTIPPLQGQDHVVEEESEKAELLLQTFFPSQPEPQLQPQLMTQPEEEPSLDQLDRDIQESEIHWAIFNSNPRKAPGPDDIPFCVWQELWPVVKEWIVHIYRRSIQLGHLPTPWAEAKIVVIQKPGKPDYSIANAYRPISLLRTISKGLEKVIARRLSEYLERTAKLPRTQFGARPRRSAEQALMILVERIYGAWRAKNVLSLVTFDVRGAYNGVNKELLQERMQAQGISKLLTKWIYSFCSNRTASLAFNHYRTDITPILQPGLPQGSPLSPILYILYNRHFTTRGDQLSGWRYGVCR